MNTLFNLIFIVLSLTGLGLSIYTFYVETKVLPCLKYNPVLLLQVKKPDSVLILT